MIWLTLLTARAHTLDAGSSIHRPGQYTAGVGLSYAPKARRFGLLLDLQARRYTDVDGTSLHRSMGALVRADLRPETPRLVVAGSLGVGRLGAYTEAGCGGHLDWVHPHPAWQGVTEVGFGVVPGEKGTVPHLGLSADGGRGVLGHVGIQPGGLTDQAASTGLITTGAALPLRTRRKVETLRLCPHPH